MTKDMFFTALLLRMYQPNQALYADIAKEAMKFLHLQEQDQVLVDDMTTQERAMPVFFHLNHHIKEVLVTAKDFAKLRNDRNTSRLSGNNPSGRGNGGDSRQVPKGLELGHFLSFWWNFCRRFLAEIWTYSRFGHFLSC